MDKRVVKSEPCCLDHHFRSSTEMVRYSNELRKRYWDKETG